MVEISIAEQSVLAHNLFAYCENDSLNNIDPIGYFVIRRWMIAAVIDFILMLIPVVGSAFAPIKALAKSFSKKALKLKIKTPLILFIKNIAKLAKSILSAIKKGLSKLWGVGKWLANKINVTKWSKSLAGLATSVLFNKILNSLIDNIDIVLSVGGAISGLLDYAFDKKLNNSIWVF